jgi:thioredoxin 1
MRTLSSGNTYLIVDFYATWCPPCKVIAPVFEQLSKLHSAPGKVEFAKVNVDEQREVAVQYGIQAMPTFLVLKDGKVVDTIKGADAASLKRVVAKAVEDVGQGGQQTQKPAEHKKETKRDNTEGLSMAERLGIKLG